MQPTAIDQATNMFQIPSIRVGENLKFMEAAIEITLGRQIFVKPPVAESRYFLVVAVCDYVRLGENNPSKQILTALNEAQKTDVRQGVARLVLDLSNEGPRFDINLFNSLRVQLDYLEIPHNNVFFVCQNRRLESDYRQAFGNEGLRFWTLDYFPITIANLFDINRANLTLGDYSPLSGPKDKFFNCFNSAPRWHRVVLYRWLQEQGHLPKGLVSFHGTNALNPKGNEIDIKSPPSYLKEHFPSLLHNLDQLLPATPLRLDSLSSFGNDLSTSIPANIYARTNLSIVPESDFFDAGTVRITEKSIKAASMGVPFVLVGPKKSISLLRDLGFKTFDRLIDHSYDDMEDIERMNTLMRTIEDCFSRMNRDLAEWQEAAKEDALFNYNHARNGLIEHFYQMIVAPITDEMLNFVRRV
ncbi:hypothetical protein [Methylobacterium sp. D54C]